MLTLYSYANHAQSLAMPLPRPIGDPFVVKDESQPPVSNAGSSTSSNGKRPISASAFSFSLGPKSTPKRTKLEPISAGVSVSSGMRVGGRKDEGNDMDTPVRPQPRMTPMKTNLDSLPSHTPLNKRLNDSPHTFHLLQTPQNHKKISDSSFSIPHKRLKEEKEEKPLVSLGSIGKVEFDSIHVEAVKKRVEEEGLGVSPRGKKIIKYHGKGYVYVVIELTIAQSPSLLY